MTKIILVLERFELFIWNLHTKQLLENQAFVLLDLRPKGIYRLIQHMHVFYAQHMTMFIFQLLPWKKRLGGQRQKQTGKYE